MDEYAFSYVSQESARLEALRAASPIPAPLVPELPKGPPKATLRRRAVSIPRPTRRRTKIVHESTDFTKYEARPWFLHFNGEEETVDEECLSDDELEDIDLLSLRDTNIAHLASCRQLLLHATTVLETLQQIKNGFDLVSDQTSSLQTSCNDIQAEEARLSTLADTVKQSLQPFSYLAVANRLLNVPGSNLVLQSNYQDLLKNLQSSLDFLDRHPEYKDAEDYARQYRQAMTKALTLARVFFASSMREISADITARTQVNAINKNTQSALLYTKFRSVVNHVRPLMRNIEDASIRHEEYWSLLNDCWNVYFGIRKALLSTVLANSFKELANIDDFMAFTASAISFMRGLALDEQELFFAYFNSGHAEFNNYLAALGQYFTDALRPRIAVESSLNVLCEICGSMQAQCSRYSDDQDAVVFDMTPILATTLGETQSRIVLRAQGAIINEIQGYKPTEKDLDYPNCLLRRQNGGKKSISNGDLPKGLGVELPDVESPSSGLSNRQADTANDLESLNSVVLYERWYVTLRVAISLLSKIYKLIQSRIFDDLAHEVVRSCIASLLHACNLIKRRNTIDGHLFLLKHLMILKEQLSAFDIEHTQDDVPANGDEGNGAVWDLTSRSAAEIFAPSALYNLASSTLSRLSAAGYLSRKVENMSDARDELDDQTRLVIGALTLYCADAVTVPLRSAMGNKVAVAKDLLEANRKFRASCPDSFSLWRQSFETYTADERIVSALLSIIQDKVLETYDRFDVYVRDLKKQKAANAEPLEVELPSVMSTVDWLKDISMVERDHAVLANIEE